MLESGIERRLKKEVEKRGGKALKLTCLGTTGMPDRLVLLPAGRIIFVELKAPGRKMRPLQRKRFEQLRALGFRVYKIDSIAAIKRFVTEVFNSEV